MPLPDRRALLVLLQMQAGRSFLFNQRAALIKISGSGAP
jgi:hypothetical protein